MALHSEMGRKELRMMRKKKKISELFVITWRKMIISFSILLSPTRFFSIKFILCRNFWKEDGIQTDTFLLLCIMKLWQFFRCRVLFFKKDILKLHFLCNFYNFCGHCIVFCFINGVLVMQYLESRGHSSEKNWLAGKYYY